jgi:hypothetical protein
MAALLQAIMPQPSLDRLREAQHVLQRHLHEPPRKRVYQQMFQLC